MTETPLTTEATEGHEGKLFGFFFWIAIVFAAFWIGTVISDGFVMRDRDSARAQVADLQKQLADLKAKPRFHADAVRFFAISTPSRRTIVVSDATVILSDSDVPQLTRKILDWLTQHPDEVGKRGLSQLRAEIF